VSPTPATTKHFVQPCTDKSLKNCVKFSVDYPASLKEEMVPTGLGSLRREEIGVYFVGYASNGSVARDKGKVDGEVVYFHENLYQQVVSEGETRLGEYPGYEVKMEGPGYHIHEILLPRRGNGLIIRVISREDDSESASKTHETEMTQLLNSFRLEEP